jgi:transcriptional regulator with XRE-family HTH domain
MDFRTARAANVTFGRRVRAYRLAAGFSQAEVGRRARMLEKTVGRIERGETNPCLDTIVLIADALGCKVADLFASNEPKEGRMLRADEWRRAVDAIGVVAAILRPTKRLRRR